MARIPTIKIKHPRREGFAIINADDFDEAKHELFTTEDENAAARPSREELEELAKDLGVKFNKRTTDAKLHEAVESALADRSGEDQPGETGDA